jgi:predicted xylose isomerase-like sugar epimerase
MKDQLTQQIAEQVNTQRVKALAAQTIIDQTALDAQALQTHFDSETARLKLEGEELERDAKTKGAKLAKAQQAARMQKTEANGALAALELLSGKVD